MLTRFTPGLPSAASVSITGGTLPARFQSLEQQLASLAAEHNRLLDAVRGAFEDLNREGALDIADAAIVASRGIKFLATQVASTDVNTLDDYDENNSYTPTLSAAVGTLTAATAAMRYTKIGNRIFYFVIITITTNGTAATNLRFTLPATPAGGNASASGMITSSGIACAATWQTALTAMVCVNYNNAYPGADGAVIELNGHFDV